MEWKLVGGTWLLAVLRMSGDLERSLRCLEKANAVHAGCELRGDAGETDRTFGF